MHENPEADESRRPLSGAGKAATSPSSSRMIASYLTDIEQLLAEQRWEAAWREACDLPRIAVALADPALHCSGEQVRRWCYEWVRAPGSTGDAGADARTEDCERLVRSLSEHVLPAGCGSVPARALRRLRLRRHVRSPRREFGDRGVTARDTDTARMGIAVVEATRRWYARSGVHDRTVQDNLGRLAVLR